jgi:Protein of unknown function (DUF3105)
MLRKKANARANRGRWNYPIASLPAGGQRRAGWRAKFGPVPAMAVALVVCIIASLGLVVGYQHLFAALPGVGYPSQGNNHIDPGDTHPAYATNPPTSGWHYSTPPRRGTYTTALANELLVHFMEHAGVVVQYNPTMLPAEQVAQLTTLANRELDTGLGLVLLAPNPTLPRAIALTAWQRLETFAALTGNTGKITDFIERLQCHYDPEGICGPPHGGTRLSSTGGPVPGGPMR